MNTIGQMSCNPAMGGIAKGQIVREIDAMGGYSGIVSDRSAIQFKMLNKLVLQHPDRSLHELEKQVSGGGQAKQMIGLGHDQIGLLTASPPAQEDQE